MRALRLLPALLAALACGDTTEKSACSVLDNGDGTRTIRCGEDELVVPGGEPTTCVKTVADDGGATIACGDGTTVYLDPDGRVIYPGAGTVVGRVTLLGEESHAGIVVRALGTDRAAVTDEKGDYVLDGLAAGIYVLEFDKPGWEPSRRENVVAVGGVLALEAVLLRRGRPIAVGDGVWFAVSPLEDTVAGLSNRRLVVHRVDGAEATELTASAAALEEFQPAYDAAGGLLFLEDVDPETGRGRAVRWDAATRRIRTVADRVAHAVPLADGAALVWRAPPEGSTAPADAHELAVAYPDGAALVAGIVARLGDVSLAPGGRAAAVTAGDTWVIDVAGRRVWTPGTGAVAVAWDPAGRRVVLAAGEPYADLTLYDVAEGTGTVIANGAVAGSGTRFPAVAFSADGERLIFVSDVESYDDGFVGDLHVLTPRTGDDQRISGIFETWTLTPDGQGALFQRASGGLVLLDLVARVPSTILVGVDLVTADFSPQGDRFLIHGTDGFAAVQLPGGLPHLFPEEALAGWFLPDGRRVAVADVDGNHYDRIRIWDPPEPPGPTVLTFPPGANWEPSPDGGAVMWTERATPTFTGQVKVRGLEDGVETLIVSAAASSWGWSPDGAGFAVLTGRSLWFHDRASGATALVDGSASAIWAYRRCLLYQVMAESPELPDHERRGIWLARWPTGD